MPKIRVMTESKVIDSTRFAFFEKREQITETISPIGKVNKNVYNRPLLKRL
jgi:hypothetical protein